MTLDRTLITPDPDGGKAAEPMARGDFRGKGDELFLIWLVNGFLTVLTLGIYFAWGKVRLYRFFYSNTEFAGDRFRFTGNGKEIFIGTLKAAGVMIALIAALGTAQVGAHAMGAPALSYVFFVAFYAVVALLSQYALYATMGYRASRGSFREIRFRLEGNPWRFAREAFPYLLLAAITFGLALPYYSHWKISRIYNNLKFGTLDFAWDAKAGEYWRLALKGFFLSVLTFGVYYFFWLPKWWAFVRGHLSVGGCRFHGDIKPRDLFLFSLANLLLLIGTLGLGTAWVMTRTMRFYLTRLALENPSRLEAALQTGRLKATAGGEAIADAMDMGVGLGF